MDDKREQHITMIDIIKTSSLDDNIIQNGGTNPYCATYNRQDQTCDGDGTGGEDVAISFQDDDGVSPRGYVTIALDQTSSPPEQLEHGEGVHLLDMGGAHGGCFPLDDTCLGATVDNFSQSNSATFKPATTRGNRKGTTRTRPATVHHSVSTEPLMRLDSPDLEAYHNWTWNRKHILLVCIITVQVTLVVVCAIVVFISPDKENRGDFI